MEQLEKSLQLTIMEGAAGAKTMCGFRCWGVAFQLMGAGGDEWECCAGCDNNIITGVIKQRAHSSPRQEWTTLKHYNITSPLQTTADFRIWCNLYSGFSKGKLPTRPPHVAATKSGYDFTEKLAANESACSDYKSTTLLMRWADVYWHAEEQGSEEEQQSMQLIQLWWIHCMCEVSSKEETVLVSKKIKPKLV